MSPGRRGPTSPPARGLLVSLATPLHWTCSVPRGHHKPSVTSDRATWGQFSDMLSPHQNLKT